MKKKMITKPHLLLAVSMLICGHTYAQSIDNTFKSGKGFSDNGGIGAVYAIDHLSNGKTWVGGTYNDYNGNKCNNILLLNSDGTIDASFKPGSGPDERISALKQQPDGKLLVGGGFSGFNGTSSNGIVRLMANGTIDNSFVTGSGFEAKKGAGSVSALAMQADGKIIAGGTFSAYNGTAVENMVRLSGNGSLDATFLPAFDRAPSVITIQPDGKILAGGNFTTVNGQPRARIVRLNTDGSIDAGFNIGSGFDRDVNAIVLQEDGKIIVGGAFAKFNGSDKACIARLDKDGSADNTFNTGKGFSGIVFSLAFQPDGKIIVGGNYTHFDGKAIKCIVRLDKNGGIDNSFDPGKGFVNGASSNGQLWQLVVQPDGKLLIGGIFTAYNDTAQNGISRLNMFVPALHIVSLSPGSNYCKETEVTINYSTGIGVFNTGNAFTAQLSNANGDFTNPTVIGSTTGTASGFIIARIPGVTAGTGYRIRLVSSSPALTGLDNGHNISIINESIPTITIKATDTVICMGKEVTLTASGSGSSYKWDNNVTNGTAFKPAATASYTVTASSPGGCTSSKLVTVKVNELPKVKAQATDTEICKGDKVTLSGSGATSYTWDNNVQNNTPFAPEKTNTYTVKGIDANKCENTDQVEVIVHEATDVTFDTTICVGTSFQLGKQVLTTAGTYTETFARADAHGCDSIVTLNLSISPADVSVQQEDRTLTASATGVSYQWINCKDKTPIVGATNQKFTSNVDGEFAVIITQNGCSDTSDCFSIKTTGINDATPGNLRLYPNPVTSSLVIEGEDIKEIMVKDISGREVYVFRGKVSGKSALILTETWTDGIYLVQIVAGSESVVHKVLKK